jgi:hypothetical protein
MKTIGIHSKKLIGCIAFILFCFVFSTSCEVEDKEYTPIQYLKISGVSSVTANAINDYYTFYVEEQDYVWTAPSGATITAGQGTSHVTVQFGDTGGILSVTAAGLTGELEITIME